MSSWLYRLAIPLQKNNACTMIEGSLLFSVVIVYFVVPIVTCALMHINLCFVLCF